MAKTPPRTSYPAKVVATALTETNADFVERSCLVVPPERPYRLKLPPKEVLPRIGRACFAFNQSNAQALKLVVGEVVRHPEVTYMFVSSAQGRVLDFLKAYLEQ